MEHFQKIYRQDVADGKCSALLSIGIAMPPVRPFAGKGGETHRDPLMQSTAKYIL